MRPTCIAFAANCSSLLAIPKQAFSRPSQLRAVKAPNSGNPLPPPDLPAQTHRGA
jgi:hypothetical protein